MQFNSILYFLFYNRTMGSLLSKQIKVVTANYSGITKSPFEFYSKEDQKELEELGKIFKLLFKQARRNPQFVKQLYNGYKKLMSELDWKLNAINKQKNKGRYCPLSQKEAGIQDGKFLTREKFLQKWDAQYQRNCKDIGENQNKLDKQKNCKDIGENQNKLDKQKEARKFYDFLIYKTFVQYAYQKAIDKLEKSSSDARKQFHPTIKDRLESQAAVDPYNNFLRKYHVQKYQTKEFYSSSEEESNDLKKLEEILKQFMKVEEIFQFLKKNEGDEITPEFDWKINQMDKSMHQLRYCPLYREEAGISYGKFLSQKQFFKKWDAQYNKNCNYIRKDKIKLDKQKETCKVYDFLIYKTFVQYAYKKAIDIVNKSQTNQKEQQFVTKFNDRVNEGRRCRKLAVDAYKDLLQRYHKKPYLRDDLKFNYIKKLIQTHDVVFLQDSSDELINQVKNEVNVTVVEQLNLEDCYILIKQPKFTRLFDAGKYMDNEEKLFNVQFQKEKQQLPAEVRKKKAESEEKALSKEEAEARKKEAESKEKALSKEEAKRKKEAENKEKAEAEKAEQQLRKKVQKQFLFHRANFNYQGCVPAICLSDQFLLISLRLSSKKQLKYKQLVKFMQHIIAIHQKYRNVLKIIIGGDFNCDIKNFVEQEKKQLFNEQQLEKKKAEMMKKNKKFDKADQDEFWKEYNQHTEISEKFKAIFKLYPDNIQGQPSTITTRKKRTWLQSQANKSNIGDTASRDFLISNCALHSCNVISNGADITDESSYLPAKSHPFDHFFISGSVKKD